MSGDVIIKWLGAKFKLLEVSRQASDQLTVLVELNDLPEVVRTLYYDVGGWLSTMIANDERSINKHFALYYVLSMEGGKMPESDNAFGKACKPITIQTPSPVSEVATEIANADSGEVATEPSEPKMVDEIIALNIWDENDEILKDEKCFITVKALIPANNPLFPAVSPLVPAAVWYEREAYDMFGLVAEGAVDKRRLVLSDDWPADSFPLRKDAGDYKFRPDPVEVEPDYQFERPDGGYTADVPLGPLHITADEPGHFRLFCDGETIIDADYRLFYQHRGMEKLAENRLNYTQLGFLAERICGICGFAHSIALAESIERSLNMEIPLRAAAIRVISAECERMHSNLLNIGLACEVTGNWTLFMHVFRVREYTLEMAQILTGGRKTYGTIMVGGVRRDITSAQIKRCLELLDKIEAQTDEVWEVLTNDRRQMSRFQGIGVLERKVARDFSPVGPNVRSAGFNRDARHDHTYGFWDQVEFKSNVGNGDGDVFNRVEIRYRDCKQAVRVIRQCFDMMPGGAIMIEPDYKMMPNSFALGYDEAPRGENVHWIMQGAADKVFRWRARASTYNNWPALRYQLRGNTIADAALIVCSLDPCYSCTDRVTLVDIKSQKSRIITDKELKSYCQGGAK